MKQRVHNNYWKNGHPQHWDDQADCMEVFLKNRNAIRVRMVAIQYSTFIVDCKLSFDQAIVCKMHTDYFLSNVNKMC